jgi:hypothetical protein
VLLVEACDALYSTFAKRGRADKLRPSVLLQHTGKQQSASFSPFIDGQRDSCGEKPFGERPGLLEAPTSIVPEIDGESTERRSEFVERLLDVRTRPASEYWSAKTWKVHERWDRNREPSEAMRA